MRLGGPLQRMAGRGRKGALDPSHLHLFGDRKFHHYTAAMARSVCGTPSPAALEWELRDMGGHTKVAITTPRDERPTAPQA